MIRSKYTVKQEKDIIKKFNDRFEEDQKRIGPDILSFMYNEVIENRKTRKNLQKRIAYLIVSGIALITFLCLEWYLAMVTFITGILFRSYINKKIKDTFR